MAELSDDVRSLLQARNMAHVATLMADGAPHVSPVWIAVEGDRLAIFSAHENLKIRNLRRDGRIGISVCDEQNPYRSVVIRGRVVEEVHGEDAIRMPAMFSRACWRAARSASVAGMPGRCRR